MKDQDAKRYAEIRFKDHVADYENFGGVSILNWRNPSTRNYSVRYVFDTAGQTLTISGDIGYAVVQPTAKVTPEVLVKTFSPNTIGYFIEKIKTSTYRYVWDDSVVREALTEELLPEDAQSEGKDVEEISSLIDDLANACNRCTGFNLTNELEERLDEIGKRDIITQLDWLGREVHSCVWLWLYGLHMAWNYVVAHNSDKRFPELDLYRKADDHTVDIPYKNESEPGKTSRARENNGMAWWRIAFSVSDETFYCNVQADTIEEGMGIFFMEHPHINYDMVRDQMEL